MSKYGLSLMNVGETKLFPLELYDKIRMSCHFTGKRHGRVYSTKKLDKTVRVTRVK